MFLVDYSKLKKILIILMIVNILWTFYNRVFGADNTVFFTNCVDLSQKPYTFDMGSSSYGGTRTVKLPSFIYDYNNILIAMLVNDRNVYTKVGIIVFSDSKIMVNSSGTIYGEVGKDYYTKNLNFYSTGEDMSTLNLTDFNHFNNKNNAPSWSGYLTNQSNYGYTAVFGNIYNYENQDDIIIDNTPFKNPQFDQSDSEIQSLDFDKIFINPYDFGTQDNLYFKILQVTNVVTNSDDVSQNIYYYNDLTFTLNSKSKYIHEFLDSGTYYYSIPYSALKLKKDQTYYFILTDSSNQIEQTIGEIVENDHIFDVVLADTQNIVTTQDEILNSIINNNPSDNTNNIINDNLPRPSYEDSNINIPGMNINIPNDSTSFGFDYIFNTIYNSIYSEPEPIQITIPFVDYRFTINPNFLNEWLHKLDVDLVVGGINNIVLDFIHAFYYFIISYYIINDVRKTIEKVKTGDIMTHTDTNIKADML